MLIRSRSRPSHYSPTYDRKGAEMAKFLLERGLARVALQQRREAQGREAYGAPLAQAARVAAAHSEGGLRTMARRVSRPTVIY